MTRTLFIIFIFCCPFAVATPSKTASSIAQFFWAPSILSIGVLGGGESIAFNDNILRPVSIGFIAASAAINAAAAAYSAYSASDADVQGKFETAKKLSIASSVVMGASSASNVLLLSGPLMSSIFSFVGVCLGAVALGEVGSAREKMEELDQTPTNNQRVSFGLNIAATIMNIASWFMPFLLVRNLLNSRNGNSPA